MAEDKIGKMIEDVGKKNDVLNRTVMAQDFLKRHINPSTNICREKEITDKVKRLNTE